MDARQVGERLVALCREGKNLEAVETLYSPQIVSVEAHGDETMPAEMRGIDEVRGKNRWWLDTHDIHGGEVRGPFLNGDRFAVFFTIDATAKEGPMAGKRMQLEEVGLYEVQNGKIVRETFYYTL